MSNKSASNKSVSILNINKPKGITSHDVVDKVKKIYIQHYQDQFVCNNLKSASNNPHKSAKISIDPCPINQRLKVGHAGTLDPFATGVLVIGIKRESTKKLGDISKNSTKEYLATLELGKTSTTLDPEGKISVYPYKSVSISKNQYQSVSNKSVPNQSARISISIIEEVLDSFEGKIKQRPPRFSAVKIDGKKSYERARKGEDFKLPEKDIEIFKIELVEFTAPYLKILVECGSGTYIRSLARDIGEKLGTGAYLTELTRTRVGDYRLEDSLTLEEFKNNFDLQFKNK